MVLLDTGIITQAIDSGNIVVFIVAIIGVAVLPSFFNYLIERKRSSKFNAILDKQDIIISEQKDVNKYMLSFLDKKMTIDDLTPIQISGFFEDFLQSNKQKILEEAVSTIKLNNLRNKDRVKERVNSFCKEILAGSSEKMSWINYKGIKASQLIRDNWNEIVAAKVIDFIYDNKYALDEDYNKLNYYDFEILSRNLDLIFKEFRNTLQRRLTCVKSDLEKKIESYDE